MQYSRNGSSGKINRKVLPAPERRKNEIFASVHSAEAEKSNGNTAVILSVWNKYLPHPAQDINANFFDLGGNSFMAIQMMRELSSALKTQISVISLFQYPSVASLSAFIESGSSAISGKGAADERIQRRKEALRKRKDGV